MHTLSPHRSSGGCSRHKDLHQQWPGKLSCERSSNLKAPGATAIHLVLPNRPVILVAAWLSLHTPGHLQSRPSLSTPAKYFVLKAGDVETKETNWHSRLFKHLRKCASTNSYLICGPHTPRPGNLPDVRSGVRIPLEGENFPYPSRPAPRPKQSPVQWVPGVFPWSNAVNPLTPI